MCSSEGVPEPIDRAAADKALLSRHGVLLLSLARRCIEQRLRTGSRFLADPLDYPIDPRVHRAAFVTLTKSAQLRGCVGTAKAWRPLVEDVVGNAAAAAFEDPRFPSLVPAELVQVAISISLLGEPARLEVESEADLIARLRPGIDGLILREGRRQALFLPQVWAQLKDPRLFVTQLKRKANLSEDYWSPTIELDRFVSSTISEIGAEADD